MTKRKQHNLIKVPLLIIVLRVTTSRRYLINRLSRKVIDPVKHNQSIFNKVYSQL